MAAPEPSPILSVSEGSGAHEAPPDAKERQTPKIDLKRQGTLKEERVKIGEFADLLSTLEAGALALSPPTVPRHIAPAF